jgi:hypothetical protein
MERTGLLDFCDKNPKKYEKVKLKKLKYGKKIAKNTHS